MSVNSTALRSLAISLIESSIVISTKDVNKNSVALKNTINEVHKILNSDNALTDEQYAVLEKVVKDYNSNDMEVLAESMDEAVTSL